MLFFGFVCILVLVEFFYVLWVMGLMVEEVYSFLWFSLGCFICVEDIEWVVDLVRNVVVVVWVGSLVWVV